LSRSNLGLYEKQLSFSTRYLLFVARRCRVVRSAHLVPRNGTASASEVAKIGNGTNSSLNEEP